MTGYIFQVDSSGFCLRSDFDEIEFCNTRSFECVGNAHNSNL